MRGRRYEPAAVLVHVAAAAFAVSVSALGIAKHDRFLSSLDLSIFTQAAWLIGHGEWPFVTVHGRHLLGDHVEPGFLVYVPFERIAGAEGLVVAQALALAAAAPVLYRLGRAAGAAPWAAAIAPLGFLASPAVHGGALFDFHPEALAPALLAAAALWLVRGRTGLVILALAAACSLKEDLCLVAAAFGIAVAVGGRRRLGAVTALAAIAWYGVSTAVILPAFGDAVSADYLPRFGGDRGETGGEIVRTILADPLETAGETFSGRKLLLVALLVAVGGLTALLAPTWLLVPAVPVFVNLLSAYGSQHTFTYQYWMVPAGGVAIAAAIGSAALRRLPGLPRLGILAASTVIVVLAAVASFRWDAQRADLVDASAAAAGLRDERAAAVAAVPEGASVAASYTLGPHLAGRRTIYLLPEPFVRARPGGVWTDAELRARARRLEYVAFDRSATPTDVAVPPGFLRSLERRGFATLQRAGPVVVLRRPLPR